LNEELKEAMLQKIAEKYGEDTLTMAPYTSQYKMKLMEQVKELKDKELSIYNEQVLDSEQALLKEKIILSKNSKENCPVCSKYQLYFNINDDVSLEKYDCCYECYIKHVDGRESRWESGWRPKIK